jgi:hypothetical protein
MAFHLGCMRALHELGILQRVKVLSTVSGGSVMGALYAAFDEPIPEFEQRVRAALLRGLATPTVRAALLTMEGPKALLCFGIVGFANAVRLAVLKAIWLLSFLAPPELRSRFRIDHWQLPLRRAASRTTIFRRAVDDTLFGGRRLKDIDESKPFTIINAAELRTGSAFYFTAKDSGSWRLCPLVCLDETSKQLLAETRVPIPMKAGRPARFDYEYERKATANLFMMFAPLEGWRHVKVTDRHTAVDYAHVLKDLADLHFASAKQIVLVQDNLNIHAKASLYEAFPAPEARRLVERFEWHYTPKHGSWLDLAESELGVLSSQCLDRRIPDKQTLIDEIAAWEHDRNAHNTKANWHFTTPQRAHQTQASIPFNLNESGD